MNTVNGTRPKDLSAFDPLRILIADDHELVRHGVRLLAESRGWEVCGEAADGRSSIDLASRLRPNVVVMDIGMPELNGIEATSRIHAELPGCGVVMLTCHDSERVVRDALIAGARGYVLKTDEAGALAIAIEVVRSGGSYLSGRIETLVLAGYLSRQRHLSPAEAHEGDCLSSREREVVQLLAEGKSNKQVASSLGISIRTAETHRANVMRKLGLHSLSEVIHFAIRNEIVEP